MRRNLLIIGAAIIVLAVVAIDALFQVIGDGKLKQRVILETPKTIRRVSYCNCRIDETTRRKAETTADARMFEWYEPAEFSGNQFTASIWFTIRSSCLRSLLGLNRVGYAPHLVILVEYEDGTHACRVVDLPKEPGKEDLLVSFK
jgi:hypothetical protein